jgi:copper oxidase (laccase) domain-containing protein
VTLLPWDTAPAGCRVVFSTRVGGVSEGPYESLNLGLLTDDAAANVVENRRRLCEAVGVEAETATMAFQVHGARVTEAEPRGVVTPGTEYEPCDGLWSGRRGQAMLLVTADCFPVALARANGSRLAVLHVGWRGLLAGIVENGARAIADGGSLTVIATAMMPLGGETTVVALDAMLTALGRFPALDLAASGTLRPELLVGEAGAEAIAKARAEAAG